MSAHSDPAAHGGGQLALASEFPAATREQWRELVAAVLAKSGATGDPEAELTSRTYDGIAIKPLYTAADVPAGVALPTTVRSAWDVRQRYLDPDPVATNAAILSDLTNGATSLWLGVGDGGVPVASLAAALAGVYLDLAPIVLDAGPQTREAASALLAIAADRNVAATELTGSLGADPIGRHARTGDEVDLGLLGELAVLVQGSPRLRVATVDGTIHHDAGGSDSDELAIITSIGVAYLRALTESGASVDDALAALEFRIAVSADQFLSIAKLRAARQMWARVAELSGAGPDAREQHQHAVTSAAMMTQRDPWVNMLRTTIACFAAAVGGADAITVAPFDAALGLSDAFARRIARNTSSVLHDESSLARVTDAAGGSWYVESLTDDLARVAWDKFTALEKGGGALAALDSGAIAELIAVARAARADDIAHRRAPITGVSEYAFLGETPLTRPAAPDQPAGGLPAVRYSAEFEALRDRADAAPRRPRIFLAALGPVAGHTARVGFAANLFAAGGIQAVVGTGDTDELVAAFGESGSRVACLCSSDKVYAESGEQVAAALRQAGATQLWLAGQASVPGVDDMVFAGCDALAALRSTLDALGVPT
jgi:methylmalonyl-CoA mutase